MRKTACPPNYRSNRLILSVAILTIGLFLSVGRALAQDTDATVGLTAIPPRVGDQDQIKLAPGSKEQVQLRIRNNSTVPITIFTQARDFVLDIDGETPIAIETDEAANRWSLASWLVITPVEQVVQPQTTVATTVLIEVPEDALPGGHYAMVTHQPTTPGSVQGGAASAVSQKVGSLFYVVVDGPINEEAFIRDFTFPTLTEMGPVPFSFVIDNQSDIHITPRLSVELYNVFNQKIETIELESKNIFPLLSREFSGEWRRIWGQGYYTAKLIMSYGEQGNIALATTHFWLFPIKIVLALIITFLTLVAIGISIRRHLLHKRQNNEQVIKELEEKVAHLQGDSLKKHEN